MNTLQVELRSPSALVPYDNNARTHNTAQINQIAASIKKFGWTNPILIDPNNGIIAVAAGKAEMLLSALIVKIMVVLLARRLPRRSHSSLCVPRIARRAGDYEGTS